MARSRRSDTHSTVFLKATIRHALRLAGAEPIDAATVERAVRSAEVGDEAQQLAARVLESIQGAAPEIVADWRLKALLADRSLRPPATADDLRREVARVLGEAARLAPQAWLLRASSAKQTDARLQNLQDHLAHVAEELRNATGAETVRIEGLGPGRQRGLVEHFRRQCDAMLAALRSARAPRRAAESVAAERGRRPDAVAWFSVGRLAMVHERFVGPPDRLREGSPFVQFVADAFRGSAIDVGRSPTGIVRTVIEELLP